MSYSITWFISNQSNRISDHSSLEKFSLSTEKIVKIIQQNNPKGGFNLTDDINNNPLLRGKVADELATNRALRDVLFALPNKMPVSNYALTSDFGIRKHPITGQSHFHTGLDLLSENGNDKVHPVKEVSRRLCLKTNLIWKSLIID